MTDSEILTEILGGYCYVSSFRLCCSEDPIAITGSGLVTIYFCPKHAGLPKQILKLSAYNPVIIFSPMLSEEKICYVCKEASNSAACDKCVERIKRVFMDNINVFLKRAESAFRKK